MNNPRNEWSFTRNMNVDVAASQAHIMASLMREAMATLEMAILLRLHWGDAALVKDILSAQSKAVGTRITDLGLPDSTILVAIMRGSQTIIARGHVALQAGDHVLALVRNQERAQLAGALQ